MKIRGRLVSVLEECEWCGRLAPEEELHLYAMKWTSPQRFWLACEGCRDDRRWEKAQSQRTTA